MTMSVAEFSAEFRSESETVEFKSGTSQSQLQDTAVAFSNALGGVILIGVDDGGRVLGRPLDAGTQDAVHQSLQAARDVGRYFLHEVDIHGKPVCVVAVARRKEGFSQTSGGVVRVRHGSRDDALFGAELMRFINERSMTRYEVTATAVSTEAADAALRRELRAAFEWTSATNQRLEEIELSLDGHLTVAGALYLVRDATAPLGKVFVELRRYNGDGVDYVSREEITGPLHHVLSATVLRLERELGKELVVLGTRRYELPRLPTIVLREAVANALGHRSYEASGTPVTIELRPSMVVVRSPGGLPEPVTVENMRDASAARNLAVMRVLRRFGLAEDAGRGIAVIQDAMADEMLDPPQFEDRGHEVVVRLPIRSAVAPTERAWLHELERRNDLLGPDRLVLVHAARGGELTNSEVRNLLNIDALGARATLQRLRDAGFLEQQGTRGGASYHLHGSLAPPAGLRLSDSQLRKIVVDLAAEDMISNSVVRAATGLDRTEALRLIEALLREGVLVRIGAGRGTKYQLRR